MARYLEKLGVYAGTYASDDGCGLSRETRYSARVMTEVLKAMYAHPATAAFRDSLPLAGYTGTMSERLAEPAFRGRVRAKTGYILGVSSLSGYARAANDKTLAFSIILNGFKNGNRYGAKPLEDAICKAMIECAP